MKDYRPDYSKIRNTASRAIRLKCLDCCCGQEAEVVRCQCIHCSLWRYRSGREQRDSLYVKTKRGAANPICSGQFRQIEALSEEEEA